MHDCGLKQQLATLLEKNPYVRWHSSQEKQLQYTWYTLHPYRGVLTSKADVCENLSDWLSPVIRLVS
jgi:hypothetical protein